MEAKDKAYTNQIQRSGQNYWNVRHIHPLTSQDVDYWSISLLLQDGL